MWAGKVQRDFETQSPYKQAIEVGFYQRADMISHAQILAGPGIERHVRNARTLVATTEEAVVTIIDWDEKVHKAQLAWAKGDKPQNDSLWRAKVRQEDGVWVSKGPFLHITHQLKIEHRDMRDLVALDRFIDADLMGSVDGTAGDTVKYLLRLQRNTYTEQETAYLKKALIFTFCMRPVGEDDTIKWVINCVHDCLGANIKVLDKDKLVIDSKTRIHMNAFRGVHVTELKTTITKPGRLVDFTMLTYNESGSPMLTGLIVYR